MFLRGKLIIEGCRAEDDADEKVEGAQKDDETEKELRPVAGKC